MSRVCVAKNILIGVFPNVALGKEQLLRSEILMFCKSIWDNRYFVMWFKFNGMRNGY